MPRSCSFRTRGCRSSSPASHAILMSIEFIPSIITLVFGLVIGVLIGWVATRAVMGERLKTFQTADIRLREAFQALSADALRTNNESFLALAESRLREARA